MRVGDTVRRPRHPRSEFVDGLLRHLEAAGFAGAPRSRGVDGEHRDVLTFVAGVVPHRSPFRLTDAQLRAATDLVRDFHDAAATSTLRGSEETVCHGDLGPHNTVFVDDLPAVIIDWDEQVAPGRRIVDFAHAVWCFADVAEAGVPVADQAHGVRLMCDGYPGMTPGAVIDELAARFGRARAEHAAHGRTGAVEVFDGLLAFVDRHAADLSGR